MTLISPNDSPWLCYLLHEQEPGDTPATSYPLKTQKDGWTNTGRTDTVHLAPRRGSWLDASPHSPQLPSGKSPRRNGSSADLAHLGLLQTPRIHRAVTPVRNTRDHLMAPSPARETWGRGWRKLCPGPGDRAGGSGARVTGSHKSFASSESATLPGKPSPLLSWHLGELPHRHELLCASSWGTTGISALSYQRVSSLHVPQEPLSCPSVSGSAWSVAAF